MNTAVVLGHMDFVLNNLQYIKTLSYFGPSLVLEQTQLF